MPRVLARRNLPSRRNVELAGAPTGHNGAPAKFAARVVRGIAVRQSGGTESGRASARHLVGLWANSSPPEPGFPLSDVGCDISTSPLMYETETGKPLHFFFRASLPIPLSLACRVVLPRCRQTLA